MAEIIWKGRDNSIDLLIKADGEIVTGLDVTVTKIELKYKDIYYSSTDSPTSFDWASRGADGVIILKLGLLSLPAGKDKKAELIIYDAVNTNGIVWGQFVLTVTEEALPTS